MTEIFNRSDKTQTRQSLRNNPSEPEKKVWYHIRNEQLGCKFRRQASIGSYIVDFYCPKLKIIVEIDGDSHYGDTAEARDAQRTRYFEGLGLKVIRFTNLDMMENIEGVVGKIKSVVDNPL
jgi:very-short-patch-repair endonuclease